MQDQFTLPRELERAVCLPEPGQSVVLVAKHRVVAKEGDTPMSSVEQMLDSDPRSAA